MNSVLIPRYGAIGASVATVIAEAVVCFIKLLLSIRVMDNIFSLFNHLWQYIFSSFVMIGLLFAFQKLFENNSVFLLLFSVILGACVYALCLIILRNEYVLKILRSSKVCLRGCFYGK